MIYLNADTPKGFVETGELRIAEFGEYILGHSFDGSMIALKVGINHTKQTEIILKRAVPTGKGLIGRLCGVSDECLEVAESYTKNYIHNCRIIANYIDDRYITVGGSSYLHAYPVSSEILSKLLNKAREIGV